MSTCKYSDPCTQILLDLSREIDIGLQKEGLKFDFDDLFPGLSKEEEIKLKTLKEGFSHYAKEHLDKMFDEQITEARTEFQRWFDTLENNFFRTLSDELKFLRRVLEEKNKIISKLTRKNVLHTLFKVISPRKPSNSTGKNFDFVVESSPFCFKRRNTVLQPIKII